MGVDIHMRLIHKDGTLIKKNLYDGRNSEWFGNLCGEGYDTEYDVLLDYYTHSFPENALAEDVENYEKNYYYGIRYISVKDYMNWFKKYKPYLKAGWASTYDKWRIEQKHWIPDELPRYIHKDDNPSDMHFIEYVDEYNCDKYVLNKIQKLIGDASYEDYIIYFFFDR